MRKKKEEKVVKIAEKDVPAYAMKSLSNMSVEQNLVATMGMTMRKEPTESDEALAPQISVKDLESEPATTKRNQFVKVVM